MSFDTVSVTRAGGREVNEDCVDVLHTPEASCWVVADGLGGHRGGAVASKLVVETALRSFREQPEVSATQVERLVEQAQEALLAAQRSDSSLAQMRSTIVVLVANDREAVWGHVGDSRLYHLRGGRVVSRTRDHSVSQALVDGGQIDHRQQGVHEDRSRLLRSLGKEGEPGRPTIGGPTPLCRGDAFLLCTDGFWEALDETAVEIDYAGAEDAAAWLDRLDARLRAQDIPLKDNYTASVICVENNGAPAPPPHDSRRPAAASVAGGGVTQRVAPGSMAAARDAEPRARADAGADASGGLFGEHQPTVLRILYALMAIALIALLYTASVAYQRYIGGGAADASDPAKTKTASPQKSDPRVSVKPVSPDPDGKSGPLGSAGGLSGKSSAPTAAAALPPDAAASADPSPVVSKEKAHYGGPQDVPSGKVFRPAKSREYASLQAALSEVGEGTETLWLGPGDFSDDLPPIAASITLKGAGRDRTLLSLTGATGLVLTGKSGGVEDLSITAAAGPAVIEIGGAFRGTIKHLRVHDGHELGILMRDQATPTVTDITYENNRGGNSLARDDAKPIMR